MTTTHAASAYTAPAPTRTVHVNNKRSFCRHSTSTSKNSTCQQQTQHLQTQHQHLQEQYMSTTNAASSYTAPAPTRTVHVNNNGSICRHSTSTSKNSHTKQRPQLKQQYPVSIPLFLTIFTVKDISFVKQKCFLKFVQFFRNFV